MPATRPSPRCSRVAPGCSCWGGSGSSACPPRRRGGACRQRRDRPPPPAALFHSGRQAQMDGMDAPALLWFRQDLRLADNPALAALEGRRLLPVFVLDDAAAGAWAPGGATRWWLHHSLAALGRDLA